MRSPLGFFVVLFAVVSIAMIPKTTTRLPCGIWLARAYLLPPYSLHHRWSSDGRRCTSTGYTSTILLCNVLA
ncbi:hypothetical protein C8R47DRAFT_1105170 [Mycena vitilis]|nr:hypothetical protein C8R47DRAFT_1105170 [Mycena vitilis]